ncbi:MAG: radical SAM protein, partial [Elusimicrobia bacterium]|nr:radical SAM protein [Elusimicrobiota bacterium]
MKKIPKVLNVIMRPLDNICNLYCKYCNIQHKYRRNAFEKKPSEKFTALWKWFPCLLEQLNGISKIANVTFTWHGGEPLLMPQNEFKRICEAQDFYLRRKNLDWLNVIQTNGLLLSDDKIDFLKDLGIKIGVSIDGPGYSHNKFRFRNRGDFAMVKNNIYLLRDKDIPFSICIVVHEHNYRDAKRVFEFISDINPGNGVAISPMFVSAERYIQPAKYEKFLRDLFDEWYKKPGVSVGVFENFIMGLYGKAPVLCYFAGRCNSFININSKGEIFGTCEPGKRFRIGKLTVDPLEGVLRRNTNMFLSISSKAKSKIMCESLGYDPKYKYFIGNCCPNRLVSNEDPYME